MENTVKTKISELFSKYEETSKVYDLKEEIAANTIERVRELIKNGASENEAVEKAMSELGDLAEVADSAGMKKRDEVFASLVSPFLQNRNPPLDKFHALGYAVTTAVIIIAAALATLTWFANGDLGVILFILAPFLAVTSAAYTYLGLTQESASTYPMKKSLALMFGAGVFAVIIGGLGGAGFVFWGTNANALSEFNVESRFSNLGGGLYALIAAVVPIVVGIALLIYSGLTQEDRSKPWFKEWLSRQAAQNGGNPEWVYSEKFGIASGVVWLLAIAVYLLIGFAFDLWHPGWLVFVFATAVQLFIQFMPSQNKRD